MSGLKCQKCGIGTFGLPTWHARSTLFFTTCGGPHAEHLHYRCSICGYCTTTPTADAPRDAATHQDIEALMKIAQGKP